MGKNFSTVEERRSYSRDHDRVRRVRGKAQEHICTCGKVAAEWAHKHDSDPADPANYQAMCRSCHQKYDGRWSEEERARVSAKVKDSWDQHHVRNFSEETRAKMSANHRTRGGRGGDAQNAIR